MKYVLSSALLCCILTGCSGGMKTVNLDQKMASPGDGGATTTAEKVESKATFDPSKCSDLSGQYADQDGNTITITRDENKILYINSQLSGDDSATVLKVDGMVKKSPEGSKNPTESVATCQGDTLVITETHAVGEPSRFTITKTQMGLSVLEGTDPQGTATIYKLQESAKPSAGL